MQQRSNGSVTETTEGASADAREAASHLTLRFLRLLTNARRGHLVPLGSFVLATALVACGLQAHPGPEPKIETGDTGGIGMPNTGGATPTGGANPSGGSNPDGGATATGGRTGGRGGATTSTGGAPPATGGAGMSDVGITINGTFVPKDKAIAFIHFGHSNMRGWASTPSSLRSYFFNTDPNLWSYKGTFTAAKEPTAPETSTQTQAGPGMAILRAAQTAAGASSGMQFISIGYGIGSKTTVDYQKSGVYYPIFMKWATALKGKVTFAAIVIMLGITDAEHLATDQVPGFPMRIAQIVSDIRNDLGEPNLPVLFCDYEQGATGELAPTGPVGKVMQPLIRMLPNMVNRLALVPTDGIGMQDDHHFNMQGHKDWSDRLVMIMQTNGWLPWK